MAMHDLTALITALSGLALALARLLAVLRAWLGPRRVRRLASKRRARRIRATRRPP